MLAPFLLLTWAWLAPANVAGGVMSEPARYIQTPMHEIAQTELYLSMNEHKEVIVSFAGKGVDLRPNDYITHADGIRLLTGWPGGIEEFLQSGEKEAVVPVVDDNDEKHGGLRLKGFMLVQAVNPRKIGSRRGDIMYDMGEGGPAPTMKLGNIVIGPGGAKTTSDPSYVPPPAGGGACISTRDCFPISATDRQPGGPATGGVCKEGFCSCVGDYTGSYCQLYRPEYAAVSMLVKKAATAGAAQPVSLKPAEVKVTPPEEPRQATNVAPASTVADKLVVAATKEVPAGIKLTVGNKKDGLTDLQGETKDSKGPVPAPAVAPAAAPSFSAVPSAVMRAQAQQAQGSTGNSCVPSVEPTSATSAANEEAAAATQHEAPEPTHSALAQEGPVHDGASSSTSGSHDGGSGDHGGEQSTGEGGAQPRKGMRRKRKKQDGSGAGGEDDAQVSGGATGDGAPRRVMTAEGSVMDQQREKSLSMDDLYGEGKAYPEPYNAGKLPNNLVHERYRKRFNRESFVYSVRFRVGPFGITFDNKINNGTFVQTLVRGEQAEQSDIKEGDQLIAVDHFNTTDMPPKVTQRVMGGLSWPRVLVFQTKVSGPDPREKELALRKRTFNLTVVYPPTLVGEYQFRLSDWAAPLVPSLSTPTHPYILNSAAYANNAAKPIQFCPVYRIRAVQDSFGCAARDADELRLPGNIDQLVENKGFGDKETERDAQMLAMLLQEAQRRELFVEPRSLGIAKRGVCTFVQKAVAMQNAGANLAIVVNNANEFSDMPAGKEKTDHLTMPIGLSTENDALLTHLAASNDNEIWAIVSEAGIPATAAPAAAVPVAPAVPEKDKGRIGKAGKNTRANTAAPKTKTPVVAAAAPAEIVFESGGMSAPCTRVLNLFEDIIDKFPHTVPPLETKQVLMSIPPDSSKTRGLTEEGGRLALSGQNGWAFFDYHLAMFGPQEVPLGPIRLQMALPPFGCDPGAYTVRIQGAVVAILRGGGCSFGIKVINAQKLGAKAVMIVNTDDMKTMRLMALPDEIPLINIPCIMVSRRIQFYLEEQLRPYFPIDQHLVSIQPTGIFGEYEKRNSLTLPERLKIN